MISHHEMKISYKSESDLVKTEQKLVRRSGPDKPDNSYKERYKADKLSAGGLMTPASHRTLIVVVIVN